MNPLKIAIIVALLTASGLEGVMIQQQWQKFSGVSKELKELEHEMVEVERVANRYDELKDELSQLLIDFNQLTKDKEALDEKIGGF